jgi:hypothetical protein
LITHINGTDSPRNINEKSLFHHEFRRAGTRDEWLGTCFPTLTIAGRVVGAPVSGDVFSSEVEQATAEVVKPGATGARVIRAQILLAGARGTKKTTG